MSRYEDALMVAVGFDAEHMWAARKCAVATGSDVGRWLRISTVALGKKHAAIAAIAAAFGKTFHEVFADVTDMAIEEEGR